MERVSLGFPTRAPSNHSFFWNASCVPLLQVVSVYKTTWQSVSDAHLPLKKAFEGPDRQMLKGISVLYEAELIFPLILTTSNGKILEPKMLYTVMTLPRMGKTNNAIKLTIWIFCFWDQNQTVNKLAWRPFFFCLLRALLLSEFDDCPLKHSFIVFSKDRPAAPVVGIATLHPSRRRLWQTWHRFQPCLHPTPLHLID